MSSRLNDLEIRLEGMGSCLLAYSGGVDSTFLLSVALRALQDSCVAVTVHSFLNENEEIEYARDTAAALGARHEVTEVDLLGRREIISNPPDRCYHCKTFLFSKLRDRARELGLAEVIDATHADDLMEYRPGLKALEELGIRSPLKETGFTKAEIREHSRMMGLRGHDRPSNPCLATRIPFHRPITPEGLRRIAGAERVLRGLGFRSPRVRDYGELARIELRPEEMDQAATDRFRRHIHQSLRDLGYVYVALDLLGYRSGSLEEALDHAPDG